MGIPKYLEEKIKSIIHCCIAAIQAAIAPNTPTFILRRPNDEPFIIDGPNSDQATVGMADYADVGTPVITGKQYGGIDVYEARFDTILSTTGGSVTLDTGIDRLFEADLVFISAGTQYYLNGTINTVCDAYLTIDGSGNLKLTWTTAHTADRVYSIVRYTLP
jgi:hypothetical protein